MGHENKQTMLLLDHPLPISKLRGVPPAARLKLKGRRITTCAQLLLAAAKAEQRAILAAATGIDPVTLRGLVQRADMARIKGIGTVFGLMLEDLGVVCIEQLARQQPGTLHDALRRYNLVERLARRSPTPEEVASWIADARRLPILVTYAPRETLPTPNPDRVSAF
jgi:predicted flap endonuclease-1-like 5' DNA nuclease